MYCEFLTATRSCSYCGRCESCLFRQSPTSSAPCLTTRWPVAWCVATLEKHQILSKCVAYFDAWHMRLINLCRTKFMQEVGLSPVGSQTTLSRGGNDTRHRQPTDLPMCVLAAVATTEKKEVSLEGTIGAKVLLTCRSIARCLPQQIARQ